MNKAILSGNLCQDIEVKQTQSGKSVVTNCIAVQREYKNDKGEYDSDFISLVIWGAQAEYLGKYAHKGDRVELVGRWTVRKYTANDGTTRTVNECVVESIRAFSRQPREESQAPSYIPDAYTSPQLENINIDDDLPF